MHSPTKIIVVGSFHKGALEHSFSNALRIHGCEVHQWDYLKNHNSFTKLYHLGKVFDRFVPVEAWNRKTNRLLVSNTFSVRPDIFLVVGNNRVSSGTILQIKASLPQVQTALYWPDPLTSLESHTLHALHAYDWVFTYSQVTVPVLKKYNANIQWLPLAGDPSLHNSQLTISDNDKQVFSATVNFIGTHRPKRESVCNAIFEAGIDIKVWGPADWSRHALRPNLTKKYWQGRPLVGDEFSKAVLCSKISINPIDETSYPTANMRFFELPTCGGLALHSNCPEFSSIFREDDTAFYFQDETDVVEKIHQILANYTLSQEIAKRAHRLVLNEHTYVNRMAKLLEIMRNQRVNLPI